MTTESPHICRQRHPKRRTEAANMPETRRIVQATPKRRRSDLKQWLEQGSGFWNNPGHSTVEERVAWLEENW